MTSPPAGSDPIFGSVRLSEAEVRDGMVGANPLLRYRWLGIAVSAVLGVVFIPRLGGKGTTGWLDVLPTMAGMIVFWTMLLLGPRMNARRVLKTLGADQGDIDYRFDDDGMTIRAPGSSATISYRVISRYRETRLTFLVYSSNLARIVPKRAFSPGDVEAVRALLETRVGPAMKGQQ